MTALTITFLSVTAISAGFFILLRSQWVVHARMILLHAASIKSKEAIENSDPQNDDEEVWIKYYEWYSDLPSYSKMIFMISVWDCNEWLKTIPE